MKRHSKKNSTDLVDTFFGLHHSSVTDNKTKRTEKGVGWTQKDAERNARKKLKGQK